MADNRCDYCGKYEMLPFNCRYCGGTYCSGHRLPEYHECPGLRAMKEGGWKPPASGKRGWPAPARKRIRMPRIPLPGQGLYAYGIIVVCILVYVLQNVLPAGFTNQMLLSQSTILARPWTLVTYMFLHASVLHIFFNMLMLFFFGPLLERQIGSARFLGLYLGSGIVAGLAQVLFFGGNVIGASAAIFGVMGALAMLMPDLVIFLYFIPMKIIYAVILFAVLDIVLIPSADQVAHVAHLAGLAVGLAYGYAVRKSKGTIQVQGRAYRRT
ncbi:MAG TPA: rhomboid family intramembrane serine protease [Methanocella sp.]|nr:rhomboid family intramembrane serine protease [Methanocella sp.]